MLAAGWSVGAKALAATVERGGRGDGKKDLKVAASEGNAGAAGAPAPVLIAGVPS